MKKIVLLMMLLVLGMTLNAYAVPYTFDADTATPGFQGLTGLVVGGTTFDLLPVIDPTGGINSSFSVGTVTNSEDQDWFLFQVSITNGGPITSITATISGVDSVGVSRIGPGFTPTDGGSSFTPPTWEFPLTFIAGRTSDRLVAAYNLGDLPGQDGTVTFGFLDNSDNKWSAAIRSTTQPVPEPATMLLLGSGLIGLVCVNRKKRIKRP